MNHDLIEITHLFEAETTLSHILPDFYWIIGIFPGFTPDRSTFLHFYYNIIVHCIN